MYPAFLGGIMNGLLGMGTMGPQAAGVANTANAIGNIQKMPSAGGFTSSGPQQQQAQAQAPMAGGQDPMMNQDSLINGGVGVLKNFFGF